MKRVLIISYYWPPTGGSGVQRWVKFSKYLPSQGWQPVIYTPLNPEQLAVDESLCAEVPPEAEVIRTRIVEPYDAYRKIFGGLKKGGAPKTQEINPVNSRGSFAKRLALALRGNLFIPDPRIGWVRPSVKFLTAYLREHPVDVMITTGPPQSMHLIGRGVKRALKDAAPEWIADFRDPWTEMFYFKHLKLGRYALGKHRRLEKSVLDEADRIIAVTPFVRDDFASKTSTPISLVTNGYDEEDFAPLRTKPDDALFRLVHTGLFAADGNPTGLWSVLAEKCSEDSAFKESLRIILAGKVDVEIQESLRRCNLGNNLFLAGYLEHADTVALQCSADLLMLPLRKEPEYAKVYPGKIFEYLAARRPVLGIGQSEGAAALLLKECGAGKMCDWEDTVGIKTVVDAAWADFIAHRDTSTKGDIERFSRRRLTRELVKLF